MKKKTSIVLTGVGGQGVITASKMLGKAAVRSNIKVLVSEVHGMAQRGGSVTSTVRLGDVSSPLVATGTADIILSTEPIEALRNIHYSSKETIIITDISPVVPFTVSVGNEQYPDLKVVYQELSSRATLHKIDALQIAKDAGAFITKNIVMLGALAATDVLPFASDVLLETILYEVPAKYREINKNAFQGGMKAVR